MGLLDIFKRKDARTDVEMTRSALEAVRTPGGDEESAVSRLVERLMSIGIDGKGPFTGAEKLADKVLAAKDGNREAAITALSHRHIRDGAVGGFATSLGGFVTMAVALPINVFEFYVQATRLVATIAHLRGYDLKDPQVRTAVLLTLVGNDAYAVLRAAGVPVGTVSGGVVTRAVVSHLPKSMLMVVNKAVGFRLLRSTGERVLAKFGKAIPVAGGLLGAGLDAWLMHKIADAAHREFPQV